MLLYTAATLHARLTSLTVILQRVQSMFLSKGKMDLSECGFHERQKKRKRFKVTVLSGYPTKEAWALKALGYLNATALQL